MSENENEDNNEINVPSLKMINNVTSRLAYLYQESYRCRV